MNKIHLIGPLLLTAAFVPCYIHFARVHAEQAAATRATEEQRRIDEASLREQRERDAVEAVRLAQLARETAAAETEKQRRADLAAKNAIALGELHAAAATSAVETATLESLRARLEQVRAARLAIELEAFELSRDLELRQIDRRNIDLDLQRKMQLAAASIGTNVLGDASFFPSPRSAASPASRVGSR